VLSAESLYPIPLFKSGVVTQIAQWLKAMQGLHPPPPSNVFCMDAPHATWEYAPRSPRLFKGLVKPACCCSHFQTCTVPTGVPAALVLFMLWQQAAPLGFEWLLMIVNKQTGQAHMLRVVTTPAAVCNIAIPVMYNNAYETTSATSAQRGGESSIRSCKPARLARIVVGQPGQCGQRQKGSTQAATL
jgi:hypothetical protein